MAIPLSGRADAALDAIADLHRDHYRSLVRLASLLLGDVGASEEVVQDAFVKLQLRWGGLRNLDKAPAYLRSAVLNGARSRLRRQKVSDRFQARRTPHSDAASAESGAMASEDHRAVVAAMRRLPERQREALALKFYMDLSEADIATVMGCSTGSVKTHVHRGIAALTALLEGGEQ